MNFSTRIVTKILMSMFFAAGETTHGTFSFGSNGGGNYIQIHAKCTALERETYIYRGSKDPAKSNSVSDHGPQNFFTAEDVAMC